MIFFLFFFGLILGPRRALKANKKFMFGFYAFLVDLNLCLILWDDGFSQGTRIIQFEVKY